MIRKFQVRTFATGEWQTYRDLRLQSLADSPEAFGSTLAEEQTLTDFHWSRRLTAGADPDWDLPLLAEADGKPIGLAWGRIEKSNPEVACLYQVWVNSKFRGIGVGQILVKTAIDWAKSRDAKYLDLSVTYRDSPAMRLYQRSGFKPQGRPQAFHNGSPLLLLKMRLGLQTESV